MKINETPEKRQRKSSTVKEMVGFFVWPFRIRFACVFNLFYHVPCLEDSHFFCLCVDSYINLFDSVSCIIFGQSFNSSIRSHVSLFCLYSSVCVKVIILKQKAKMEQVEIRNVIMRKGRKIGGGESNQNEKNTKEEKICTIYWQLPHVSISWWLYVIALLLLLSAHYHNVSLFLPMSVCL